MSDVSDDQDDYPPIAKRTRFDLTLVAKNQLICDYEQTPRPTQKHLAEKYGIGRTTVGDIIKRKEYFKERFADTPGGKKRFYTKSKYEPINRMTHQWFVKARAKSRPITGSIVKAKALSFAGELGISDFKASDGWLTCWKDRIAATSTRRFCELTPLPVIPICDGVLEKTITEPETPAHVSLVHDKQVTGTPTNVSSTLPPICYIDMDSKDPKRQTILSFSTKPQNNFTPTQRPICGMELGKVVDEIKDHAAVSLAESWDNVGLLVEPSAPHTVKTLLLTNDLTPPVLEEAIGQKVDFILSYHPPIFSALKRLRQSVWKERLVIKCIENRIAVYSSHTCYDAKLGGVNDWLISAFDTSNVKPIENSTENGKYSTKINLGLSTKGDHEKIQQNLLSMDVQIVSSFGMNSSGDHMTISSILCQQCDISSILQTVQASQCHIDSIDVIKLEKVPITGVGSGRVGVLKQSIAVSQAVQLVKNHLNLDHIRLATEPSNKMISNVAVCAGSGSSVLRGVRADLYVTGEMSHHEVLDAVYNGSNVILCDHSNTERGYLSQVQQELSVKLPDVNIIISKTDTDPLKIL